MLLFEPVGIICTKIALSDETFATLLIEAATKAGDDIHPHELEKLMEWEEMTRNMRENLECLRAEKYGSKERPPDTPDCRFRDKRTHTCLLP